jgi:hypothetical protein
MRLSLPVLFLAAVAVPLSRALDDVAWEIRVRDAVRGILASEHVRTVQSSVLLERHSVSLRLIVIASPEQAAALERRLETRLAAAAGVTPSVLVTAVPDAGSLQKALARVIRESPATPQIDFEVAKQQLSGALRAAWPDSAAGRIMGWSLEIMPNESPQVVVRHLGPPLGAAGEAMLARSLSAAIQTNIHILDVPFPKVPITLDRTMGDSAWLSTAALILDQVALTDSGVACVQRPPARSSRRTADAIVEALLRGSGAARNQRIVFADGSLWAINVAVGQCH